MNELRFDWTISLGTVLHLAGLLLGGVLVYVKINERLTRLETKMDLLMKWWERVSRSEG